MNDQAILQARSAVGPAPKHFFTNHPFPVSEGNYVMGFVNWAFWIALAVFLFLRLRK